MLLAGAPAHAQVPSGELRIRLETESGGPVAGALVALVDSGDNVVAEGLSAESGTRLLRAPAGIYRVRVRRIGYGPFISEPVTLPRMDELQLRVESAPVVLSAVVVAARAQCTGIDLERDALTTVWDEIIKALRATQLTAEDLASVAQARVYRQKVLNDRRVASADTTLLPVGANRPFRALNPALLSTVGYVIGSEDSGWEFYGADEMILLSAQFKATHCFRLARERDRNGQIGLAFEPVPRRRVSDIAGALWVDEQTSELRELVYRYTNAGPLSDFGGGGYTRFRRMPSGAWMVDEWWLRVPLLERQADRRAEITAIGYVQHGGDLVTPEVKALKEK